MSLTKATLTEVVLTDLIKVDELAAVYRKVHAAELHLLDHSDPSIEERLRWTAEAPGFAAAVAHLDGQIVGAMMGCPLPPETLWWRDLGDDVGPEVAKEWPGRTFALCEAFVLPEAQKHRLAATMIADLLDSRPEERVSLAVAESNARVWRAMQLLKYEHVGNLVPFPGWRSHRMLVRALR